MKPLLLCALLFPTLVFAQPKYDYQNLVLEGGGIKGLAYAGVFAVLEEQQVLQQIQRVAGTSAGSIAGLMVSIGYTASEIDSVMMELPIQKFNDGKGGVVGKYRRFRKGYGIYKGRVFEKWLQSLIEYKTGNPLLSFAQLHQLHLQKPQFKDFYCTGTNLSRQRLQVFSYEHSPHMPLAQAVRISCSIPLYFEPVALDDQFRRIKKNDTLSFVNYYVDGGMLSNYPISIFDS